MKTRCSCRAPAVSPTPAPRPFIVLKVADSLCLPPHGGRKLGEALSNGEILPWKALSEKFPGATVDFLHAGVDRTRLAKLSARAQERNPDTPRPNLFSYLAITADHSQIDAIGSFLARGSSLVEAAYLDYGPTAPPMARPDPSNDVYARYQSHLGAGPFGIDAFAAWKYEGGTGDNAYFTDVEQGWYLHHDDLPKDIASLRGANLKYRDHGCAVLGIILGADNTAGGIGIAPGNRHPCVASEWLDRKTHRVSSAILNAASYLGAGDVLLIESQYHVPHSVPFVPDRLFPIETKEDVWVAIREVTDSGITVIEPAGNGALLLDHELGSSGWNIFDRSAGDFRDSGAIMVGAGVPDESKTALIRKPGLGTNYGRRIDCHALGAGIHTTWPTTIAGLDHYTNGFSGTSGAAAIIAGAALLLQSIQRKKHGVPHDPARLRDLFRNEGLNKRPRRHEEAQIGCMPNLAKVLDHLHGRPAP
jgi:hypothetical protein